LLGLGIVPIGSLPDLAERHFGIDVECGPFGSAVSGMCVHAGPIALILANTQLTIGHLRFTLAHELAHHLLGDPREVVIEDGLGGNATVERRANSFAAHLLMPADEVRRVIAGRPVGDEVLAELMQYFQVSLACVVNHLVACKVIDFGQRQPLLDRPARWLVRQYGDPGQEDPTREGQGVRPPVRLLTSARIAHRQGRMGGTIVAALLGTAVHEITQDPTAATPPASSARSDSGGGLELRPAGSAESTQRLADEAAAAFADL
jgi:IrrE N-terminal-like domain